jgi:hypothetical protein
MNRYYSTLRPVAPGTFPNPVDNPVVNIENFDARSHVGIIGREAWGYVEYEKPLTDEQIEAFDLVAASDSEDKDKICKLLCKVLQKTRGAADLISLDYDEKTEIVTATFEGGNRNINVACDSGTAMIRDIVNHLGC